MALKLHLIVPIVISALALGFIFFNRRQLFNERKQIWLWRSLTVFLLSYFLIVGAVTYIDISADLALQTFDLNGDGNFSADEQTPQQKKAMHKVIADNARNFSCITGLIYSGIITLLVFILGKAYQYIKQIKS